MLGNEKNNSWSLEILDQLGRVVLERNNLEGEFIRFCFFGKKTGMLEFIF
jgi:hypothetical protein